MRSRVTMAVGVLLVLAVCCAMQSAKGVEAGSLSDNPVRFAILGDRTGEHVDDVYDRIVLEVERLKPEFVITVGDMIEGYSGDTAVYTREWREYMEIVRPLSMPIYFTPGNHDITNEVAVEPYNAFHGSPYHSFDHRGIHVTVLDNSRWPNSAELPAEQLAWLEEDLKANQQARWSMVFFHQPCWYQTVARGKSDTLHTLFKAYGVDAVFCGHFHQYFSALYDGIKYTAVGSSGGDMGSDTAYLGFHYAWVTADDDSLYINPIRAGSVLPWDHHTVDEMYEREKVRRRTVSFTESVEVDPGDAGSSVNVTATITNLGPVAIDDTLRWEELGQWTVEPNAVPVQVAPGENIELGFAMTAPGFRDLFPSPSVSLTAPYNLSRSTTFTTQLPVARRALCLDKAASMDASVKELLPGDGSSEPAEETTFRFLWDDTHLYLVAHCLETQPDSVVTSAEEHDDAVYADDCVGYFIQPDPTEARAYQLYFNSRGVCFDQLLTPGEDGFYHGDRSWNCDARADVVHSEEGWLITVPITWTMLGLDGAPARGSWIGLNFRRKQHGGAQIGNFQVPIDYDPKTFGRLYFSEMPVR